MDCNQPIDWKTGLICAQCKVPFCVSNCLVNHSGHRLQNIPQTSGSSGDDIFSKIIEADNTFKELKFTSNSMADFLRNFDNEITNHQLKIFSLKERISNMPKNQFSKQQVDVFADRHNSVLKNITHMHSQMFQQMKDAYRFWGTIAAYNYDELVGVSILVIMYSYLLILINHLNNYIITLSYLIISLAKINYSNSNEIYNAN